MAADTTLEFVRDALTSLRQDVSKVYDKIDDFVDANQALHRDIEARLATLEHPTCRCQHDTPSGLLARVPWLPLATKVAWPIALIGIVLLRTAPDDTQHQVQRIAQHAAGIPDVTSAASAKPHITPASTTWTVKQGGPR